MIRLFSEWDIGQDGVIFGSQAALSHWLRNNHCLLEMAEDANIAVDELIIDYFSEGLLGTDKVEVVE